LFEKYVLTCLSFKTLKYVYNVLDVTLVIYEMRN